LLLVAFVSVPWMLLAKPLKELEEHKRTAGAGYMRAAVPSEPQSTINMEPGQVPILAPMESTIDHAHDEDGAGNEHGDHGEVH
jgi:hypothetical protein